MSVWISEHLDEIKALAGPVATVVASLAAMIVTILFGRAQTKIAKSQRDIARSQRDLGIDNVKLALFDRRLKVYEAVNSASEDLVKVDILEDSMYKAITEKMNTMELSVFLFAADVVHHVMDVYWVCGALMAALERRETIGENDPNHSEIETKIDDLRKRLKELSKASTEVFITPLRPSAVIGDERLSRDFFKKYHEAKEKKR